MAGFLRARRRRAFAHLSWPNGRSLLSEEKIALEIQRRERNVLRNVGASRCCRHQSKTLHHLDRQKSEVVFRIVVAEAQETRIVMMIVLQARAEGRCHR